MNNDLNCDKIIDKVFLTPEDLASLLSISRPTVYRLIERRQIPFYKIGGSLRFKKDEILTYLEKSRFESFEKRYECI